MSYPPYGVRPSPQGDFWTVNAPRVQLAMGADTSGDDGQGPAPPQPPPGAPAPVPVPPPATGTPTGPDASKQPAVPSGGNLRDPAYARQLVAYWATQPGANPSLGRDPDYWINKITSGELGTDENYIIQKFKTPEGAPAGSGGGPGGMGNLPPGFQSVARPTGTLSYPQAVQYIQSVIGRPLQPEEIQAAFAKYGGNQNSQFTADSLDPVIGSLGGSPGTFDAPPTSYSNTPYAGPNGAPLPLPTNLQGQFQPAVWTGGDFVEPTKSASLQKEFAAPTLAELQQSPGYAARLAAVEQAQQRSAAAQGTVLNAGTQRALGQATQDYASNEYQNLYGQNLATRQENVGEYNTTRGNAYQDYMTKYGQFQDANANALAARQQNVGEYKLQSDIGQQSYTNRYNQWLNENNRTLTNYMTNVNTRRGFYNDYWGRLKDLYTGGVDTANNSYKFTGTA